MEALPIHYPISARPRPLKGAGARLPSRPDAHKNAGRGASSKDITYPECRIQRLKVLPHEHIHCVGDLVDDVLVFALGLGLERREQRVQLGECCECNDDAGLECVYLGLVDEGHLDRRGVDDIEMGVDIFDEVPVALRP